MEKKELTRIAIACIVLLLLSAHTLAIGIGPGSTVIDFQPGESADIQMLAVNDGNAKQLFTISSNSPQIVCDTTELETEPGSRVNFLCTVHFPETYDGPPGIHEIGRVTMTETAPIGEGIGAVAAVQAIIRGKYPYTGPHIQVELIAEHVKKKETVPFTIRLRNIGSEAAAAASLSIAIFNQAGELVGAMEDIWEGSLAIDEEKVIQAAFETGDLQPGTYKAIATVPYDGKTVTGETEFKIGDIYLELTDILAAKVQQGTIGKLQIDLGSFWSEAIEYTLTIEIRNNENLISQWTTELAKIEPWASKRVEAFWESKETLIGLYDVKVIVTYAGKTGELLRENILEVVGAEAKEEAKETGMLPYLTLLVVIILGVLVITILLWKRRRKKSTTGKEGEEDKKTGAEGE
ncbi:hypothetical protein HYS48_01725 [Candidatus Woesearchaeota archaeon]|nr:hypothetical protein [Candidatus Woesearchaeota archaeon]